MHIRARAIGCGVVGLVLAVNGVRSWGQVSAVQNPPTTVTDELAAMAGEAGVIFAGRVMSVRWPQDTAMGLGSGWVEIEFRVEQAVLGCAAGATYTLREWAGLWMSNANRYRVGEERLMFLRAPSESGLSSPVGGQDGAIPITGAGSAADPAVADTGGTEPMADLRWVQARVMRQPESVHLHAHPVQSTQTVLVGREQRPMVTRKTVTPEAVEAQPIEAIETESAPVTTTPLRSLMQMLAAWEVQRHAAQ